MHRRVNITLPEETLALIDRAASKGDRSRFIAEAVRYFVKTHGTAKLRHLLKEGYQKRAAESRAIAEEWFEIENEVWPKE